MIRKGNVCVAEYTLKARSALDGFSLEADGARLAEVTSYALVSLAGPSGGLPSTLIEKWGLELAEPGRATFNTAHRMTLMSVARDQWFLRLPDDTAALKDVRSALNDHAALTDQSDSWVQIELTGPAARDTLERLLPIDTHPSAFPEGAVARSVIEHLGVIVLRQPSDENSFLLLGPRSSAKSFLHALTGSPPFTPA
jgi:sarcosine oxidase subunit gamma